MNYFTTEAAAHKWAQAYGYNYTYRVVAADGMFAVIWNYREPAGC